MTDKFLDKRRLDEFDLREMERDRRLLKGENLLDEITRLQIAAAVRHDADTASQEELEAAAEIYDRLVIGPNGAYEPEYVDIIASGYEWTCDFCGLLNKEIEYKQQVKCARCSTVYKTNSPTHAIG